MELDSIIWCIAGPYFIIIEEFWYCYNDIWFVSL